MKTAGRATSDRWAPVSSNRVPGAGGQNRSCSIQWAAKQEKFQPLEMCFFLTSTLIELIRNRKSDFHTPAYWPFPPGGADGDKTFTTCSASVLEMTTSKALYAF